LVILSGDFLAPSLLSSLDKGVAMVVDILNKCGVTHVCFGNHECDVPMQALQKRILSSNFTWINSNMQELNAALEGIDTPDHEVVLVSSNKKNTTTTSTSTSNGTRATTPTTKRVGLLGLLTNEKRLYRPGSYGNARIEDIIPTTQRLLRKYDSGKHQLRCEFLLYLE
jgi:5'-nucleotidase